MIVVHHYYPMGSENVGDELVARAIGVALRRHWGEVRIVPMPANDRWRAGDRTLGLRGDNLERTNREADLVVIGGSNMLEPRSKGRWGVFTDAQSIERLTRPLMLIGMGNGSDFGHRIRRYREPATTQVRLLHAKAFATTVRDITTEQRLARIGVRSQAIGCPVMFLTDQPVQPAAPVTADRPLLVSFPPPRIEGKWGGKLFMRAAMDYIRQLQARGVNMIVTLHDTRDLEPARQRVPEGVEIFLTTDMDQLIDRFENSAGVIGFRLHAALLGLGLGKPVIPVGVDWRGLGFIRTFHLENESIRSMRPGQFSKLRRLTDRLLQSDPQLIAALAGAKQRAYATFDQWLAKAASDFRGLPPRT